jgi:hypothetical protein
MKMRNLALVLGMVFQLALQLMWIADASASCNSLTLTLGVASYSFNSGTQAQLSMTVNKSGGSGCNYFVAISHGGATDYNRKLFKGTNTIGYQLYTGNPFTFVVKDIPDATSNTDVLPGSFTAGNKQAVQSYWAVLGNTAYQAWGIYQDTVSVNLYQGNVNGTYTLAQSQSMSFSYNEPKAIDLSLVPSGAAFDLASTSMNLAFGTLTTGKTLGFDAVMKYNAGYKLSVSSQNAGNMFNSATSSKVSYALSANGSAIDLSAGPGSPAQVSTGGGVSPAAGTRIPIAVTIGDISKSLAGNYSDFLTLVVTSTE